jgi:hypothetical protein
VSAERLAWPGGALANLVDADHELVARETPNGDPVASTPLVRGGHPYRLRTGREVTIPAGSLIEHVVTPHVAP